MGYALYSKFSELVQLSYILSFYIPVNPCFPIFSTSSILINLCPTELWGVLTWRNLISSFACYDQVVVTEVWQKIEGDRKCEDHAAVWIVGVWCVSLCYIQFWSTCRCYHAYIWSSMPFWPGKKSLHLMFGVIFFLFEVHCTVCC